MYLSWITKTNIDDDTLARLYKNWSLALNLVNHKLTSFSLMPFMELATPE